MDELSFSRKYLGEIKTNKDEIMVKYCPFCNGGMHKDQYTFSINKDKHTFNCLRGKCGERGTFKELCDKYGEEADYYLEWLKENKKEYTPKQIYTKPKYKTNNLTDNIILYFNKRGISKKTLEDLGIRSFKGYGEEYATFQFYKDEKLLMNKFRLLREAGFTKEGKKERKEWKEPGGLHILWNMDNIDKEVPVVLTEGMIDASSVYEAGYKNVVSIPSGTNDLTWIDNCYDWIQEIKEWIIYVDNDIAGEKLKNELLTKLGYSKCRVVKHELKDTNDELKILGKEYILRAINNAELEQVKGLLEISRVKMLDPSKMEKCLTGIRVIDKKCGGFIFPSLNIWTGKRGHGKSTVLSQAICKVLAQNYTTFVYTGELAAGHFKLWMYNQLAGPEYIKTISYQGTGLELPDDYVVMDEVIPKIDRWMEKKLYLYDNTTANNENEIIRLMEEAYKRYNCRVFMIDNLMTVDLNANKDGHYMSETRFINRLREFMLKFNVVVNLVIHPNKSKEQDNDSVGGSGNNTNAAFNVFWVNRIDHDEEPEITADTIVKVTKNRYYGATNVASQHYFDIKSKRLYSNNPNEISFGWEKGVGIMEVNCPDCPF